MAAAECRGYCKVGGLADVVYDLSRELVKTGQTVHVVLPLYSEVPRPKTATFQFEFQVSFDRRSLPVRVWNAAVDDLVITLLEADYFSGTWGSVYIDSGAGGKGPFEDDAQRFAFFSAAVWELIQNHEPFSSVALLHCHDWHTGLIPLFCHLDKREKRYPTVFTIHNLDYQGTRPWNEAYAPGASWSQWFPHRWEQMKTSPWFSLVSDPLAPHCFNPMRCGITTSDAVNTVSPSYAKEITLADDPPSNFLGGRHLEPDLKRRHQERRLWGILNGLDYEVFNPAHLDPPFEARDPQLLPKRTHHKSSLLKGLATTVESLARTKKQHFANADRVKHHLKDFLEASAELPLAVCVTRAVQQKLGLFSENLSDGTPVALAFLDEGWSLLIIGTGELEQRLEFLNDDPRALFLRVFDTELATKFYAAGDLFLMPSDFEPCGISQLMALRFGCLPLVHDRGGLHDTVFDGKTGFSYQGQTRDDAKLQFLDAARRARVLWDSHGREEMIRTAMEQRFSWEDAVVQYRSLYRTITRSSMTKG